MTLSPLRLWSLIAPATNRRLETDDNYDYVELEERREREPLRQRRYLDEDSYAPQPRRYVRDDGPLDVDPLDDGYGSPPPRRREPSTDPW